MEATDFYDEWGGVSQSEIIYRIVGRQPKVANTANIENPGLHEALKRFPKLGRWILNEFQQRLENGENEDAILEGLSEFYLFDKETIVMLGREATTFLVQEDFDAATQPLSDWVKTFGIDEEPSEPRLRSVKRSEDRAPEPLPLYAKEALQDWGGGKFNDKQYEIMVMIGNELKNVDIGIRLGINGQAVTNQKKVIYSLLELKDIPRNQKSAYAARLIREIVANWQSSEA